MVVADGERGRLVIFLGDGTGLFNFHVSYPLGVDLSPPTIVDVNEDPYPDVILSDPTNKNVSVFIGKGDGTFRKREIEASSGITPPVTGDVNDDGNLDLIVTKPIITWGTLASTVVVLLGDGSGGLWESWRFRRHDTPILTPPVLVDLDRDDNLDLVFPSTNNIYVFLGDGQGKFVEAGEYRVGENPWAPVPCDIDADGDMDLVVSNENSDDIAILLNSYTVADVKILEPHCILGLNGRTWFEVRVRNRSGRDLAVEGFTRVKCFGGEWKPLSRPFELDLPPWGEERLTMECVIPDYVAGHDYIIEALIGESGEEVPLDRNAAVVSDCRFIEKRVKKKKCLGCHSR